MIIEKTDETNFEIKDCGKLASSSYFDKPTRVLCPDTKTLLVATSIDESTNNNLVNPNNQQEPQNQSNITNDTNLYVRSCIFSPNDTYLAWICGYKIVKIMKYKESKTLMRSFSMDPTQTNSTNTNSNTLKVNDIAEIECAELVKSLAFGSSKSFVSNRHNLHLRTSKLTNTRFNIGENNLLLAVGLISGKIRIYDATSLTFLLGLFDHTDMVNDLKFTVDGSLQLASASSDETIKLWNIYEDGNMYKTIKGHHAGKINCCDWSPTAKLLCSVGINRQAYIWDTESFKLKHTLRGHLHNVSSCKFSPDGALLATGSYDTKILIWNPYSGVAIKQVYINFILSI
jgi:WD repeat/SOCS box-containing protein 1